MLIILSLWLVLIGVYYKLSNKKPDLASYVFGAFSVMAFYELLDWIARMK